MGVNHGGAGGGHVPPEFTTYNVLNNAVCHLLVALCNRETIYIFLYLFAHGIMYYTAFNAGSV